MRTHDNDTLIPRAEEVYRRLALGDYGSVGRQMTFVVRRLLTERKVMQVWAQITDDVGGLDSVGESFVRPSGRNTVVETPLHFETGALVGRIAYNRRQRIVGIVILPPDAVSSAPF